LIILAGCGTKEAVRSVSDEEALRERVTAYWGHKIRQEFDKSYPFEDPFYRKNMTIGSYVQSFDTAKARWTSARTEAVRIEGDTAVTDMMIGVRIMGPSAKPLEHEVPLQEKWIKVEGVWYHVLQKIRPGQ